MGKTIQSDTLKLLHDMISKFKQNQEEREVVFKEQCLDTISYYRTCYYVVPYDLPM